MYKRIVTQLALIGSAVIFSLGFAQQHPQNVSAQAATQRNTYATFQVEKQHPQNVSAQTATGTVTGTIAYVVGDDTTGDQIWFIEPDGSNNRKIYSTGVPDPYEVDFMTSLAWRPDAGELIFTSNHEEYCSWYNYDVYAILPDGSGYRRVTNGPACAGLAAYPQGSVTLDTSAVPNGYQVYVQGAPTLKTVLGSTLNFRPCCRLGKRGAAHRHRPRALPLDGWLAVDVKAGQNVTGEAYPYSGYSDQLGAYNPVWRRDGSRVGYAFGCADLRGVADHAPAGDSGQPLFDATGVTPCVMDWGPTAGTANQILYFTATGNAGIYHTTENGGAGTRVVEMEELSMVFRIQYLPDASGFIFTFVNSSTSSDVYRYDFQSDTITQLTDFSHEYARDFSISPDGKYIVFERAPEGLMCLFGCASKLWIMGIDGSNLHPLPATDGSAIDGAHPTWIQGAIQMPTTHKLFLPLVKK